MTEPSALARRTSRGAIANLLFGGAIDLLAVTQGIVVPRLLGPDNIGLFALAGGGVAIGMVLKGVDLPRKVVQERDVDLHTAYGIAFTLEMLLAGSFFVVVLGIAPVLAHLYDRPELWLLTSVLAATIFTTAFAELPAAIPYREMRFMRRNVLTAVGPVVTFVVTVPAAYLGAGVWALVAGTLAGFGATAVVLLVASPVRPSLMWDGAVVRRFLSFGWPAWLAAVVGLAGGWGAVIAVSASIGVAGLAYFDLAQSWAGRALQIDAVLADTVFPALCSMQSSVSRLRRAFITISRLSMVWAAPVGAAVFLFAQPAVSVLLGAKWQPAVLLLQAEGLGVVANSIGYSWHLFYTARGQTKPWLVMNLLGLAWTVVVVVPLVLLYGIAGAAMSIVVLAIGSYALRQHYVRKMFGPVALIWIVRRELLIGALPAAVIGLVRLAGWTTHDAIGLVTQAAFYLVVAGGVALLVSRDLLREVLTSLRKPPSDEAALPGAHDDGLVRTPTPRSMAFPLLPAGDDTTGDLWVTTRDWPALGRLHVASGEWTWFELPPFPHAPTPDGLGGCWTALTRSSAIAHIDADGAQTLVRVPKTRELLVTTISGATLWAVDAHRRLVHRVDTSTLARDELPLPPGFTRPDFVATDSIGRVWVADTQAPLLAVISPGTGNIETLVAPYPTRGLVPDPDGGMWLGASDRAIVTLVDASGAVRRSVALPGIPFGMTCLPDGRLAAAVKAADLLALVDPDTGAVSSINFPAGSLPMGCAAADGRCFVTLAASSEIGVVDLAAAFPV